MQGELKRKQRKPAAAPRAQPALTRSAVSVQAKSVVGKMLWKEFYDPKGRLRLYQGQVVRVHSTSKGCHYDFGAAGMATVKYFVQYDDGDTEDMTHTDVLRYLIE